MSLRSWLLSLLFCLPLTLALPRLAHAKAPTCGDPFDAVDSVWRWQPKGKEQRLDWASACLEASGRTAKERQRLAQRLMWVYDHEGAMIDLDRLKELKPDYVDPASREARVVPHERFPKIVLERKGGKWLWTKASLDWMNEYYAARLSGLDWVIERMPAWLEGEVLGLAYWQYLALALLLGLGVLTRWLLRIIVGGRLRRLSERTGRRWAVTLGDVVGSPAAILIVAGVLRWAYPQLRLPVEAAAAMQVAVRLLVTVAIVWASYRGIDLLSVHLENRAARTESKLDDQLVPIVRKALKVVVVVAGVLLVLQTLDVNVPSLVAGLGLGGLAVALAAKDALANLFGSLTILLDGPFQIGDYVSVDGVEGTIEEVGLRSTRIRTFEDSLVVFPNAKLADSKIDNFERRRFRREQATFALAMDTSPEQVQAFVEGVRAIVRANRITRKDSYEVHLASVGPDSLGVFVQYFLKTTAWSEQLRERHNILLECLRLASSLGVRLTLPSKAVRVEQSAPPTAGAPPAVASLKAVVESFGPEGSAARPAGPIVTSGYLPTPAEGA